MYNYSFIIPHKNCPDLLQRCVDSIPERDDVQVIVVDDNSDEGKKPSLKERKNLQVILLDASQSKGAGRARNVGLKQAEGKWLLFADADDYYCDNFIDIIDRYSNSDNDVVYFDHIAIDAKGLFTNTRVKDIDLDKIRYTFKAPWNKLVRKDLIDNHHIWFEEVVNGNDMFFSYQVGYYAKKITYESATLYRYNSTQGSMTNRKKNSDEYYLCRINHWYQTNEFYLFVNHPEWRCCIMERFAAIFVKKGMGPFIQALKVYIKNYWKIKSKKKTFVNHLTEQLI